MEDINSAVGGLVLPRIAAMAGYTPGEQPQEGKFIKLNTNENPYPPSPAALAALAEFDPCRLRLYPDPVCSGVRRAAAAAYGLAEGNVLVGNGSDDILTMATRAFVGEGQSIACFEPSYSLYPVLAEIQGAKMLSIPLDDDFSMPANSAAAAADAKLFFIARPNAPTGNAFPKVAIERLCREFRGVVLIDEAYADFADDNCLDLVRRRHGNVIVSRTLSKSYSLAGARVGLALSTPAIIAEMVKVKDSYNVNALSQRLAAAALADGEYLRGVVAKIRASREELVRELRARGFEVLPSQANFVFAAPPDGNGAACYQRLRSRGVLVRYFPDGRTGRFIRITIGLPEQMAALLKELN